MLVCVRVRVCVYISCDSVSGGNVVSFVPSSQNLEHKHCWMTTCGFWSVLIDLEAWNVLFLFTVEFYCCVLIFDLDALKTSCRFLCDNYEVLYFFKHCANEHCLILQRLIVQRNSVTGCSTAVKGSLRKHLDLSFRDAAYIYFLWPFSLTIANWACVICLLGWNDCASC